jgi:hypothetical protein
MISPSSPFAPGSPSGAATPVTLMSSAPTMELEKTLTAGAGSPDALSAMGNGPTVRVSARIT